MQVDKNFKLNLTARDNIGLGKPDASYDVFFHMDDYGDCTNVENRLESDSENPDMKDVDPEDRLAVEEALVEWLDRMTLNNTLMVTDGMTLNVAFNVTPDEITFAIFGGK